MATVCNYILNFMFESIFLIHTTVTRNLENLLTSDNKDDKDNKVNSTIIDAMNHDSKMQRKGIRYIQQYSELEANTAVLC